MSILIPCNLTVTHSNADIFLKRLKRYSQPFHTHTHSVVCSPVHLWPVVQPEDEVGQQLEEVLPQENRHIKVNVAYVRLAHVSSEAHVAHADEPVDQVSAVAAVQTRVGFALVHILLAPKDTRQHKTVYNLYLYTHFSL